jgi:hypothetical protein
MSYPIHARDGRKINDDELFPGQHSESFMVVGGTRSHTREEPTLASFATEWIREGSGATKEH